MMATTTERAFEAVERDDVESLRALLLQQEQQQQQQPPSGAPPPSLLEAIHPFDDTRPTLLHRACARGHLRSTRLLLERGAGASRQDYWGFTALHKASDRGHWRCVRELVARGSAAAANHSNSTTSNTSTADVVNAADYNRSTPLVWAAWRGHLETVQVLLEAGADSRANGIGNTPLHVACHEGRDAVVRALIGHYQKQRAAAAADADAGEEEEERRLLWQMLTARNDDRETPLDRAARHHHLAAARLVIQACARHPQTTLHGVLTRARYVVCGGKTTSRPAAAAAAADDEDDDDSSYSVQLDIGTLDKARMHSLLEALLASDPGAIRRGDENGNLPLAVACATSAPTAVVDFLLRTDPDALLFL